MRCTNIVSVSLLFLFVFVAVYDLPATAAYRCAGRVSGRRGNVIGEANVSFYAIALGPTTESDSLMKLGETATDPNGIFLFIAQPSERRLYPYATILVEVPGLAMAWRQWKLDDFVGFEISLAEPARASGRVVDDSGKAIADAEVSLSMLYTGDDPYRNRFPGLEHGSPLTTRTDSGGGFAFDNLPADARMEFAVYKDGYANADTTDVVLPISQRGQFRSGQRDIRLTIPVGGAIRGVVVDDARDPLPGVPLQLMTWYRRDIPGREVVITKQDGAFEFTGMAFGDYVIGMPTLRTGVTDWVFGAVEVKVRPGQTPEDITIRANKGGLVQFVVTEAESGRPVADAAILLYDARTARPFFCRSNSEGIAKIRLPVATYSITDVSSDKGKPYPGQYYVTVRRGTEVSKEIELFLFPNVTGVAVDREGAPVEGATVKTLPMGQIVLLNDSERGYELARTKTLLTAQQMSYTGPAGQFDAVWYLDKLEQRQIRRKYVVLRHTERNLAAAEEVTDERKALIIDMQPGVTVSGRVMDADGRQLDHARITLYMVVPGWRLVIGELLTQVNERAEFEIAAVPRGYRFALNVSAEGYGVKEVRLNIDNAVGGKLDLGNISLSQASLQISGIVVDVADKPVPGARLTAFGRSNAVLHTATDARGKFLFDNVSESEVVISAAVQGLMNLSGTVQAKSPARDVKIVVRDAASAVPAAALIPTGPPSLANNDLPELTELGVDVPDDQMNGRMLLIAFWDMNQRPSRHCITQLAERSEQLRQKGVTVIAVQAVEVDENTLKEWLKENSIGLHTGIIKTDYEKTTSKWGVASMPWLILTDTQHKVRAEGFGPGDVDDKIEEINGA